MTELADPGQRLLARVVDTLIVGLPVVPLARSDLLGLPKATADVVAVLAVAGLLLLYETVQLAMWGRTLGKRFAGIEVVREAVQGAAVREEAPAGGGVREEALAGEPPGGAPAPGPLGVPRALLRSAMYSLPLAARPVPVLGVVAGIFWVANAAALFEGKRRQALHDRLAGTVVVRRPSDPGDG